MTQNPPPWGPQGGYPPQPPPGGYPPQQPPGGYPPQQPPGGYPPQQPPPGYNPQGGYKPQGGYAGQGAYPPQGPPPGAGYPPQGPTPPQGGGYPPRGAASGKKSPALIIGIVVAAVVLLAAIGGIFMVLRGGGDQPPPVSITPSQPVPPTDQPTPSPTEEPTPGPTTEGPTDEPSPGGSTPPSGDAVDLGNGIALSPAAGWEVKKTGKGLAQLSDGKSVFLGQVISADPSTNAGQLCTAWHQKVAEGSTNGKFGEPKTTDLGTTKLKASTCNAQVTVSNGQGTATIVLFTLVSVRQSDGVTVLGTAYFTPNADTQQLDKDFSAMVNSMLQGQVKG
jgi:hypothetical protein